MLSFDAVDTFSTNRVTSQGDQLIVLRLWQAFNVNLIERIPKVDGFYSLYLAAERDIHFRLYGPDGLPRPGLADFLGVSQVAKSTGNKLFAWSYRDSWLPMTTLAANPVFLEPRATLTNLMRPDFNPRQTVFLRPDLEGKISATNGTVGRILSRFLSAHRITVEVETAQPNLLVVAQVDYPAWKASIDGKPVPTYRANHAFQAIEVPPGRHRCELRYQDNRFRLGLGLSALTACVCIGLSSGRRGEWGNHRISIATRWTTVV
jgi:hypothetical protein